MLRVTNWRKSSSNFIEFNQDIEDIAGVSAIVAFQFLHAPATALPLPAPVAIIVCSPLVDKTGTEWLLLLLMGRVSNSSSSWQSLERHHLGSCPALRHSDPFRSCGCRCFFCSTDAICKPFPSPSRFPP